MTFVLALFKAVAAIPSIKDILNLAIAQYIAWLDAQEAIRINKAARSLRNAKSKEEIQAALKEWVDAAK